MDKTFLTDRKEIARAINIEKIPTIRIDISKEMDGYPDCYEGDRVVIVHNDGDETRCTAKMFSDGANEKLHAIPFMYEEISLMPDSVFLSSSFGYRDVQKMYEWSKAIRVRENSDVIIFFDNGSTGYLRKMKVGSARKFVFPTAKITD